MNIDSKEYLLNQLVYLEVANYRRIGKLDNGKYAKEPTRYHLDLLEIYGHLSKESIIKLLKMKPMIDNFKKGMAINLDDI
jgi:hypothetical protein|tara:strand:- start:30 stop:269 length:240 start_codon:yes stop_codon:yes gene_type:complete